MNVALTPLRHVAEVLVSNVDKKSVDGDLPVRLVNYTDVYYRDEVGPQLSLMAATATREQLNRFGLRIGDSIITKDSETANDIAVPTYVAETASDLVCGYHLAIVRPRNGVNNRYLSWALRSEFVRGQLCVAANGMTRYGLTYDAIRSAQIPMLGECDQAGVAIFLDDQVARIDNTIAARTRQIDLVEKLPWQYFSTDIAAAAHARLPLRRVLSFIADGPFGSAFGSADYVDEGPAVIRLGDIGFAEFRANSLARIPADVYDRFPRCHIEAGDLLIASLGDARTHAGRACVAPESLGPAMVKGKCFRAQVNPRRALPTFLARLLSSETGIESLERLGRGSTRTMLNIDVLMSAEVPVPALSDQVTMMANFDRRSSESRTASNLVRESLERLGELRASLIAAAVTGKFDVSTADGSRVST